MYYIWPAEEIITMPLVMASDRSAVECDCGYISIEDAEKLISPMKANGQRGITAECGCYVSLGSSEIHVTHEDRHLTDDNKALAGTWYHTTTREDWIEDLLSSPETPYVHVGSKLTALKRKERLDTNEKLRFRPVKTSYLYELRLKPDTYISPEYMVDFNEWPTNVEDSFEDEENETSTRGEAIRYINIGETPGAISMIIDPRKLEVVSVSTL